MAPDAGVFVATRPEADKIVVKVNMGILTGLTVSFDRAHNQIQVISPKEQITSVLKPETKHANISHFSEFSVETGNVSGILDCQGQISEHGPSPEMQLLCDDRYGGMASIGFTMRTIDLQNLVATIQTTEMEKQTVHKWRFSAPTLFRHRASEKHKPPDRFSTIKTLVEAH